MNMVLQNNLGVPAVAFFRGKFAGHALQPYPVVCDSATCDVAVPFADCSDDSPNTNNAEFTGVAPGPDNIRTFYFKIQAGESASFYLDSTISMFETETWVVPETFATVMAATVAKGPDRLSAFQMTNDMVSGTLTVCRAQSVPSSHLYQTRRRPSRAEPQISQTQILFYKDRRCRRWSCLGHQTRQSSFLQSRPTDTLHRLMADLPTLSCMTA